MLKQILWSAIALLLILPIQAQQELSLHLMRDVVNANMTNPAIVQDSRIIIGLPSVYFNYFHTAGAIDQIIRRSDGRTVLDVNELIRRAKPDNQLDINLELQSLFFQYRLGALSMSLHHAVKSNTFTRYPKALPQLFWQGNAQFIGEKIEFGPEQQSFAYNELGLGLAYEKDSWTIGGRAKLLMGIGDVSTERNSASLFTSDDIYQLELESDYLINTSVFDPGFLFDSLDNVGIEYGWEDMSSFRNFAGRSTGFAFDLGLRYQPNEKLDIALSLVDVGKINWTDKVANYRSQGTFAYDGLDFSNILQDENISFEGTLDTIEEIFNFNETNSDYSTKLASKLYVSGLYQLTPNWQLGALYYMENFRDRSSHAVALSARTRIADKVNLGAVYAIRNDRYDNFGLNASVKIGPVQLFAHTDNILAAFKVYDSDNVNFRAGLNLLFL